MLKTALWADGRAAAEVCSRYISSEGIPGVGGGKEAQASMASFPLCSYKSNIYARAGRRGASVAAAGGGMLGMERGVLWKREMCCLQRKRSLKCSIQFIPIQEKLLGRGMMSP